jgi:hypothetical protein
MKHTIFIECPIYKSIRGLFALQNVAQGDLKSFYIHHLLEVLHLNC